MTPKEKDPKELPVWIYRGVSITLLSALLTVALWAGGRILQGVDQTAASVGAIREQLIRLESRLDDQDRRLQRVESWRDSWSGRSAPSQP